MITSILIDDERPALRELEYLLKNYQEIVIVDTFTDPLEAIEKIRHINPQVVFLDINMPQLKGIDAAARILDLCPHTDIVFVTAHNQYAIEAFDLHALDYILKPISEKRFQVTIQRLIKAVNAKTAHQTELAPAENQECLIRMFGSFNIEIAHQSGSLKWRSRKTRELIAFLIHHAGREVMKEEIVAELWGESATDQEKSFQLLYNGIYYIRKTLDKNGVTSNHLCIEGNYKLTMGNAVTDVMQFTDCLRQYEKNNQEVEQLEKAVGLYTGEYLADIGSLWAEAERELLSRKYVGAVLDLSELYLNRKEFRKAEDVLLRGYALKPYAEDISRAIINLYVATNNKQRALEHYRDFAKKYTAEMGLEPDEEIKKLVL